MLFDSHTHLQFAAYDEDRDVVIDRAKKEGVSMINVGTDFKSSLAALDLARAHNFDGVYATLGFHPTNIVPHHDTQEKGEMYEEVFDVERFNILAQEKDFVMIGECGLDYFRIEDEVLRNKEKEIFMVQLEVAVKFKKPLMIHCRPDKNDDAYLDLYNLLEFNSHRLLEYPGIIHFFVGSNETAKKFLDLGFYLSFGGAITFKSAEDHRERVRYAPLDRIVLETDAPYVTPEPYRGKRNEPVFVKKVAEKIAEIKQISFEEVRRITFENTKAIIHET